MLFIIVVIGLTVKFSQHINRRGTAFMMLNLFLLKILQSTLCSVMTRQSGSHSGISLAVTAVILELHRD